MLGGAVLEQEEEINKPVEDPVEDKQSGVVYVSDDEAKRLVNEVEFTRSDYERMMHEAVDRREKGYKHPNIQLIFDDEESAVRAIQNAGHVRRAKFQGVIALRRSRLAKNIVIISSNKTFLT